jgi:hypothetical protein
MAHDVVIRGGDVIDGTGAPAFRADLAVDGDPIKRIGGVAAPIRARLPTRSKPSREPRGQVVNVAMDGGHRVRRV